MDQRINQLEKNLREAKQKYEKLLSQCASLTSAMDLARGSKSADFSGGGGNAIRRSNIVRPVRGGTWSASDAGALRSSIEVPITAGVAHDATNSETSPSPAVVQAVGHRKKRKQQDST